MPACKITMTAVIVALSSLLAGPALAGAQATEDQVSATVDRSTETIEGFGQTLDPAALDAYRGGDDSVDNHVDIDGLVDGNTAQDTISGNNVLGGGAFSNASGISTVIQNSGSNVLIQNGMVVNVQFAGSAP